MITDERVFDDDYPPRSLMHREGAVETMLTALEPAAHGTRADDVLISGPSGVGKTALANYTVNRVEAHAGLPSTRIQCLGESTGSILRAALAGYPRGPDPTGNTPVHELPQRLRGAVDTPYVVICDEADDLAHGDALDELVDIPLVSVVVICHDPERWLAAASDRVRDTLATHVSASRYSTAELADILEARADQGLVDGAVTVEQLRTIADEVAGVARDGIQTLRAAAELADERGHVSVQGGDLVDAYDRARHSIRVANLASLPYHHQVLYALIYSRGPLTGRALHEAYAEVADELYRDQARTPIGKRSRRDKLRKLAAYDLITVEGEHHNREYRVVDGAVEPSIELPASA